jgi:hypothetical protein
MEKQKMNQALQTQKPPSVEERLRRLEKLDFASIRRLLGQPAPTGFGWGEETALEAERLYRQFLHLILVEATEQPVPNTLVDAFWHAHILDTKKYREDCQNVFGYFLDHNPGFGANGDVHERDRAFAQTVEAHKILFGNPSDASMCGSSVYSITHGTQTASMCGSSVARN